MHWARLRWHSATIPANWVPPIKVAQAGGFWLGNEPGIGFENKQLGGFRWSKTPHARAQVFDLSGNWTRLGFYSSAGRLRIVFRAAEEYGGRDLGLKARFTDANLRLY